MFFVLYPVILTTKNYFTPIRTKFEFLSKATIRIVASGNLLFTLLQKKDSSWHRTTNFYNLFQKSL